MFLLSVLEAPNTKTNSLWVLFLSLILIIIQPQLITTMYIQLQMIIYKSSVVVLHTCTQTLFHTQHIREMQEIFKRAHNNKRQYFIEPFLIRSVRCNTEHFWRSFLSSPLILSRLTTAVVGFFVWQWQQVCDQFLIWGCITSILAPNITTRWIPCPDQIQNGQNMIYIYDLQMTLKDSRDQTISNAVPLLLTGRKWTPSDAVAASYVSPEAQWHCGARPVGKRRFWPYGK